MNVDGETDTTIRRILTTTRRIALVGASMKPWRASHGVMRFLLDHGFDVTPVNPLLAGQLLHGRMMVGHLQDAVPLDMVDVFRNSSHVDSLVDEAIRLGATSIWMQLGVVDQEAAARARAAGITVVMDRCPVIEDRRLGLLGHRTGGSSPTH
ncbi:MAG TPA: CoA-binding protein [Acetobacteraceae bacterium]|nr:CoA-binding protein [Acetobacteraceae bacterium]